jgi:signal transduction histidine kinase
MPMHTKIKITDFGMGIDKNDWHLIFKRFYRGANAKSTEGAGLGLYLAALIMEKQGGYIMVDSVPHTYTSFSLFLQNC